MARVTDCGEMPSLMEASLKFADSATPEHAHTAYGLQITGGSSTTWSEFDRYRQAGALTRELLIKAAATELGVAADTLKTENGFVVSGDKKSLMAI